MVDFIMVLSDYEIHIHQVHSTSYSITPSPGSCVDEIT